MNVFEFIRSAIVEAVGDLAAAGTIPDGLDCARVAVEPPRDPAHGDVATNAAMVLAKPAGLKPRDLAEHLAERLRPLDVLHAVDIAGPGFINFVFNNAFWQRRVPEILAAGTAYGDSGIGGGEPVNIEYVSANPTGPLHVGHGRGAVVGDALAALLEKTGYNVTREYYINDAGGQVDALGRAVFFRYLVAIGLVDAAEFARKRAQGEIEYGGDYLIPIAAEIAQRDGETWAGRSETEVLPIFRRFAIERLMEGIRQDLEAVGIRFAVFSSERALVEAGRVEAALDYLTERDLVYTGVLDPPKGKVVDDWEERPQTLFRATRFGDEVDRPLRKHDGAWTYFASDIAYHYDKYQRGFRTMIDVWGADHGGYVKRMQAAAKAMSQGDAALDVKLCQLVNLLDGGVPVKMSKRAGTFVTLREVVDQVGRGVFRFIMLTRRNDASLDFDLKKVVEESRENPVFYVQYAHARCCSVLRLAAAEWGVAAVGAGELAKADLTVLRDPAEIDLIRVLASWPRVVEGAAIAHEPHRVAFYLHDVAESFHTLWTKGREDTQLRFIEPADWPATRARLALVEAARTVIASALAVMGVDPVEELR